MKKVIKPKGHYQKSLSHLLNRFRNNPRNYPRSNSYILIPLNLRFFDQGEKTEEATEKKKEKARGKGQTAKSQELSTAFLLIAVFFALKIFGAMMYQWMLGVFSYNMSLIKNIDDIFNTTFITGFMAFMFGEIILISLPIMSVALGIGVFTNVIQVGWKPTAKPLAPSLSRLNPLKGLKRLFSLHAIVDLVKAIAKFGAIAMVVYFTLKGELGAISNILYMGLMEAIIYVGALIIDMGLKIGFAFLFIATFDYGYSRLKHRKDLRMTKEEVKEEFKQSEGNPQVKTKIRQKMRDVSMRRMMQDVSTADVIITNPTHYAVALSYDKDKGEAPRVVAKGVDYLAKRIKDKGNECGVEIVENVGLARALYAGVDIGGEIPQDLYQTVAEVLALVYALKGKTN